MKNLLEKIKVETLASIAASILWLINVTIRWHRAGLLAKPDFADILARDSVILVFWHNRQLFMPFAQHLVGDRKRNQVATLISRHRDGRIIASAAWKLGLDSVAGSSSRGAAEGLRGLMKKLEDGIHAGITPDGPRGPIYKMKDGAVKLARLTGKPIYPISNSAERKWQARSWDRMIIPKPFSKAVAIVGEPMFVPKETPDEELPRYVEELEKRLIETTRQADEFPYA